MLLDSLGRFLHWWFGELAGLLPPGLRRRVTAGSGRWVVRLGGDTVQAGRETLGEVAWLPAFSLEGAHPADVSSYLAPVADNRRPGVLLLDSGTVLAREVEFPRAVSENLRATVGFELDRLTPFRAEQVYFDCARLDNASDAKTVRVELALVQRSVLDRLLDQLSAWGLVLATATHRLGAPHLNLLPDSRRPKRRWYPHTLRQWLMVTAVVLLVLAIAAPLWELRQIVLQLNQRIAGLQGSLNEAQALRQQGERLRADMKWLVDRRISLPLDVAVVEELAALIDDGSWMTRLQLEGNELVLQGETRSATELLSKLEEAERFEGVAFSAPVTRNPRTGTETFKISARLAPPAEVESAP